MKRPFLWGVATSAFQLEGSPHADWASWDSILGSTPDVTNHYAVKVVLHWINQNPSRKYQTLLIVVADHETGGFAVNGPYGTLSVAGDLIVPGWTSGDHTAVDTMIWSQGPGSNCLGKAVDNTYLFQVMKEALH
jgi:alkaline phosphatase